MTSPDEPHNGSGVAEALLSQLPVFAREQFTRRAVIGSPPNTIPALFAAVRSWLNGAGIAEGRGGYPGGRGKPGWRDYVAEQRRSIAVLRALVDTFGTPSDDTMNVLADHERSFPPAVRRMGDGYEPHVDDEAGRLIYSLPVDSGFVGLMFAYEIGERDLQVLLTDPYRRAVLEVVAHTVLQHSSLRGNREVTQLDFCRLLDRALHRTAGELAGLVEETGQQHNILIDHYVRQVMKRPAGTQ